MGLIGDLLGINPKQQMMGMNQQEKNGAMANVQGQMGQQQDFVNALGRQGGLANQSNIFNQMQGFAGQLQDQANGGGPNPALAQLANTTGQNISNQAALMAGQRGGGVNPGLAARNIGQMGAAQQQQAVGQAATMRAQQQLGAQQALQNQQALMGNLANSQINQQQGGLAQLANQGLQNQQSLFGLQASANAGNAGQNAALSQMQGSAMGGLMNGLGGAVGKMNQGGEVPQQSMGFSSAVMNHLNNMKSGGMVHGQAKVSGDSVKNDTVPAMLSPGEIVIPRSKVNDPKAAKAFVDAILAKKGIV